MPDFSNGVATPGGASYMAPLLSFQQFANWSADDPYQKTFNQQQQTLNQQRIQTGQQQLDASKAFANGNFIDKNGLPDYGKMAQTLLRYGDVTDAVQLLQQQVPPMSPMLGGAPQGQGQPQGQGAAPPSSAPAQPLPAPAASSPQGDPGTGTLTDLVTSKLPQQDATTGQTIGKIATALGVDPNAQLTPGQIRRAQGLLRRYAPAANGAGGSSLPPSANAVMPAPQSAPQQPASFRDRFAAAGQPQAVPAPQAAPPVAPQPMQQPQPQAQPQQQPQQPLVPQVPLPKDPATGKPFADPQQAILALHQDAARLSAFPKAAGQVAALNDWAARIEDSIKPVSVNSMTTLVDPRTRQPIFEGAGAAAIAKAGNAGQSLDADAERYRQTGTLPPNMGRGAQGAAEAQAIRARAAELEVSEGGDPAKWPDRWQDYRAAGVGKSAGERVKANREENLNLILKAADAAIPAALEASKALPRSDFVPLNKLIQHGEVMSSNPQLIEFGMANLQLAEHWARAMNPTGVMRESDRDKALSFLSTAYGSNTYERAVMQLQKQITRERDAVKGGGTSLPSKGSVEPGGADKDGWVTAPNGALIREKS